MGIADAILDLVSSGTTLKENNLKEIEGGIVLQSQVLFCVSIITFSLKYLILFLASKYLILTQKIQAVLVASRESLIRRKVVLDTTHEILERFEAHLRAEGQFTVRKLSLFSCVL